MKYRLLKEIPGNNVGDIIDEKKIEFFGGKGVNFAKQYPDFFEPIVEKKTYDDLKKGEICFFIDGDGGVRETCFVSDYPRSQTFLTREEAEDEHKRREWACRRDKFVPENKHQYYYADANGGCTITCNYGTVEDILIINLGLAFRTIEECEKAIKEDEIIRLFYTIR